MKGQTVMMAVVAVLAAVANDAQWRNTRIVSSACIDPIARVESKPAALMTPTAGGGGRGRRRADASIGLRYLLGADVFVVHLERMRCVSMVVRQARSLLQLGGGRVATAIRGQVATGFLSFTTVPTVVAARASTTTTTAVVATLDAAAAVDAESATVVGRGTVARRTRAAPSGDGRSIG